MFNVGGGEVLVILLIALLVLGPDKLPEYTRKAARAMGELRRISQGFQNEMREAMDLKGEAPTTSPSAGPRLLDPPSTRPWGTGSTADTGAREAAPAEQPGDDAATGGSSAA